MSRPLGDPAWTDSEFAREWDDKPPRKPRVRPDRVNVDFKRDELVMVITALDLVRFDDYRRLRDRLRDRLNAHDARSQH